jgi:hypothetical protein
VTPGVALRPRTQDMRSIIISAALLAAITTQAHADFAQSFMNGFEMSTASTLADAAQKQAEANSPAGQCLAMQINKIMRQKKMPAASVVHTQMDAARAYCKEAFGG